MHVPKHALEIIEDIDCWYDISLFFASRFIKLHSRISAVPPFPGLHQFADGHDFKQWTGDDSKVLMKVCVHSECPIGLGTLTVPCEVFLAAIAGYVPLAMVCCIAAFMDTCYIAH